MMMVALSLLVNKRRFFFLFSPPFGDLTYDKVVSKTTMGRFAPYFFSTREIYVGNDGAFPLLLVFVVESRRYTSGISS